MATLTKVDCYYKFEFANGMIIHILDTDAISYDVHIDCLNDVISKKSSCYAIMISNENWLVFKIIKDDKIKISIITDFMHHNPDNKYLKPLIEFTINYDDCINALKSLRDIIIQNIT
jgi:hypothetical protein